MTLAFSPDDDPKTLVSTAWLAKNLNAPDLRLIDASWFMPGSDRDPKAEYAAAHIPGARFFDIDEISDQRSNLPHMLPTVEKFTSRMRALGIGDGHQLVVYDSTGIFSAPRVWWTFRAFGKQDIAVLDGGLPKWRSEGRPLDALPPVSRDRHLTLSRQNHLVRDVTQVAEAAKLGHAQVLDARGAERFMGNQPEPRPGLRSGHIPGARNLPFAELLTANGTMKPPAELREALLAAGIDLDRPVITSCGSGITAAILALALERVGHRDWSLYDGSWTEWGMFDDLPVETGPAR